MFLDGFVGAPTRTLAFHIPSYCGFYSPPHGTGCFTSRPKQISAEQCIPFPKGRSTYVEYRGLASNTQNSRRGRRSYDEMTRERSPNVPFASRRRGNRNRARTNPNQTVTRAGWLGRRIVSYRPSSDRSIGPEEGEDSTCRYTGLATWHVAGLCLAIFGELLGFSTANQLLLVSTVKQGGTVESSVRVTYCTCLWQSFCRIEYAGTQVKGPCPSGRVALYLFLVRARLSGFVMSAKAIEMRLGND